MVKQFLALQCQNRFKYYDNITKAFSIGKKLNLNLTIDDNYRYSLNAFL